MMQFIKYTFLLLFFVFLIAFASANAEPVLIRYYVGSQHLPLIVLLLLTFTLGVLLGLTVMLFYMIRSRRERRQLKKRIKLAEKEISNLRTMPIKDAH